MLIGGSNYMVDRLIKKVCVFVLVVMVYVMNGTNLRGQSERIEVKGYTLQKVDKILDRGFTSVSWDSNSGEKRDEHAFIFSINNKKMFKTTNYNRSIYCSNEYGPFFGGNKSKDYEDQFEINLDENNKIIVSPIPTEENINEDKNLSIHKNIENDN